jgi:hypothetical protein
MKVEQDPAGEGMQKKESDGGEYDVIETCCFVQLITNNGKKKKIIYSCTVSGKETSRMIGNMRRSGSA